MNKIRIFENPDFGQIRTTVDEKGEALFCLRDVCKVLGLKAKHVTERLDDRVVSNGLISDSIGRKHKVCFVNEIGFYDTVLDSRKPIARAFRKWVTGEVLPQIRKTGGYIPMDKDENANNRKNASTDEDILTRALVIANKTIALKDKVIEVQRPSVEFAKAITSSKDSILIRDLAKLITQNGVKIGQGRLFYWLRLNGYLFKRETRPIQKWVELGIFDTNISLMQNSNGKHMRVTTKVTGKGQQYFIDGFVSGRFKYQNLDFLRDEVEIPVHGY